MYSYFKGIIEEKLPGVIVLEVNNIGYNIIMSDAKIDIMPEVGSEVRIYTHTHVKEDAFELYGFTRKEELNMFRLLLGVSGIGPRSAMSILSLMGPEQLASAILLGDSKTIAKAQGVGKKTAERVIIDLRDKAGELGNTKVEEGNVITSANDSFSKDMEEALQALEALGYNNREAKEAILKTKLKEDSEAILKKALKNL